MQGLEPHAGFVANGATDFVRADPEYDAGIMGAMKRSHMAEAFGLDVEFQALRPAHRRCIAATRNINYYELTLAHPDCQNTTPPVYEDGYSDRSDAIDHDGRIAVPSGPGLGVKYDWDYIENNQTGTTRLYE